MSELTEDIDYTAKRFRKKPVVIEAMQWLGYDNIDAMDSMEEFTDEFTTTASGKTAVRTLFMPLESDLAREVLGKGEVSERSAHGYTAVVYDDLHGTWVNLRTGQWVIKGVQGEFYPCDAEVFAATYEPVKAHREERDS